MFLKLVRQGLGRLIVFIDFITRPKKKVRAGEEQSKVDEESKQLALYQFYACPFCVKVRRVIHQLNLSIECRDVKSNPAFRKELLEQGGKIKVPCLRIEQNGSVKWLYESKAIVQYLKERF